MDMLLTAVAVDLSSPNLHLVFSVGLDRLVISVSCHKTRYIYCHMKQISQKILSFGSYAHALLLLSFAKIMTNFEV